MCIFQEYLQLPSDLQRFKPQEEIPGLRLTWSLQCRRVGKCLLQSPFSCLQGCGNGRAPPTPFRALPVPILIIQYCSVVCGVRLAAAPPAAALTTAWSPSSELFPAPSPLGPSSFPRSPLCLSLLFSPGLKFPAKDRCSTSCTCSSHELGATLRTCSTLNSSYSDPKVG